MFDTCRQYKVTTNGTAMDGISLILCCHNSSSKLPKTLEHVNNQQLLDNVPWELIIVDNASTDETYQVALALSKNAAYETKVVTEARLGLKNARLKGAAESKYEFISFIDDDNWICPQWVQIVYEIMSSKTDVGACGGESEPAFDSIPPSWFESVHESFAVGRQCSETGYVPDSRGYLWGGGLTVRRTAWDNLLARGFDFLLCGREGSKLTSGEDTELCLALRLTGWKLWYEARLKFVHYMPTGRLTPDYVFRLYRAFGNASVILDYYKYLLAVSSGNRLTLLRGCVFNAVRSLYKSLVYLTVHGRKITPKTLEGGEGIAFVYHEYELGRAISYLRHIPRFLTYFDAIYNLKAANGK